MSSEFNYTPTSTSWTTPSSGAGCTWCGGYHYNSACPRLEEIEYHPDGTIKRLRLRPLGEVRPVSWIEFGKPRSTGWYDRLTLKLTRWRKRMFSPVR